MAEPYAALGDGDGAITELVTADRARCPWFFQTLADPRLKSLWGRPEFEKMRASLQEMETAAGETPDNKW
jgi:hypothetical protein